MLAEIYVFESVCLLIIVLLLFILGWSIRAFLRTPAEKRLPNQDSQPEITEGIDEVFFFSGAGFWRIKGAFWVLAVPSICVLFVDVWWSIGAGILGYLVFAGAVSLFNWREREQVRKVMKERRKHASTQPPPRAG